MSEPSVFTATIAVERVGETVTFTAAAFNGGKVTLTEGDQDGRYEAFIALLGALVDAAQGQLEVTA